MNEGAAVHLSLTPYGHDYRVTGQHPCTALQHTSKGLGLGGAVTVLLCMAAMDSWIGASVVGLFTSELSTLRVLFKLSLILRDKGAISL